MRKAREQSCKRDGLAETTRRPVSLVSHRSVVAAVGTFFFCAYAAQAKGTVPADGCSNCRRLSALRK